jgi:uncharacterized protein (UPF0333 family)
MKLFEEERAQGSLEVLLMLAAAVLMAAMVGLYLKGASKVAVENKAGQVTNEIVTNIGEL